MGGRFAIFDWPGKAWWLSPEDGRGQAGGNPAAGSQPHSPMWGGITATYFRPEFCSTLCIRMWSLVTSCSRGGTLAGSHSRKAGGTQGRVSQGLRTACPGPQSADFVTGQNPTGSHHRLSVVLGLAVGVGLAPVSL